MEFIALKSEFSNVLNAAPTKDANAYVNPSLVIAAGIKGSSTIRAMSALADGVWFYGWVTVTCARLGSEMFALPKASIDRMKKAIKSLPRGECSLRFKYDARADSLEMVSIIDSTVGAKFTFKCNRGELENFKVSDLPKYEMSRSMSLELNDWKRTMKSIATTPRKWNTQANMGNDDLNLKMQFHIKKKGNEWRLYSCANVCVMTVVGKYKTEMTVEDAKYEIPSRRIENVMSKVKGDIKLSITDDGMLIIGEVSELEQIKYIIPMSMQGRMRPETITLNNDPSFAIVDGKRLAKMMKRALAIGIEKGVRVMITEDGQYLQMSAAEKNKKEWNYGDIAVQDAVATPLYALNPDFQSFGVRPLYAIEAAEILQGLSENVDDVMIEWDDGLICFSAEGVPMQIHIAAYKMPSNT